MYHQDLFRSLGKGRDKGEATAGGQLQGRVGDWNWKTIMGVKKIIYQIPSFSRIIL